MAGGRQVERYKVRIRVPRGIEIDRQPERHALPGSGPSPRRGWPKRRSQESVFPSDLSRIKRRLWSKSL
jgi:hypothetical protein